MIKCTSIFIAMIALCLATAACERRGPSANDRDADQVARGKAVYRSHCAACHGENLEGQPNWRERLPNGKLPAPPHDATGHTWEHPDDTLFEVVKHGVASKAGPAYQTDMLGFAGRLTDEEIWAVLAYIKSTWPEGMRRKRQPKS